MQPTLCRRKPSLSNCILARNIFGCLLNEHGMQHQLAGIQCPALVHRGMSWTGQWLPTHHHVAQTARILVLAMFRN
jgi:hypothetical protein